MLLLVLLLCVFSLSLSGARARAHTHTHTHTSTNTHTHFLFMYFLKICMATSEQGKHFVVVDESTRSTRNLLTHFPHCSCQLLFHKTSECYFRQVTSTGNISRCWFILNKHYHHTHKDTRIPHTHIHTHTRTHSH